MIDDLAMYERIFAAHLTERKRQVIAASVLGRVYGARSPRPKDQAMKYEGVARAIQLGKEKVVQALDDHYASQHYVVRDEAPDLIDDALRASYSAASKPLNTTPCPDCKGSGVYIGLTVRKDCPTCAGTGKMWNT